MNEKIVDSIRESVLCWLATVDSKGVPNVSPKEVFASYGEEILIGNIASPGSAKNILSNPHACVSFINVFSQKGYKVKGKAKVLVEGEVGYEERYNLLYSMVGDKFPISSIFSVSVDSSEEVVAPSYKLFPETTVQSQIESAFETYGVKGQVHGVV